MTRSQILFAVTTVLASAAQADVGSYTCEGNDPDWTLTTSGSDATFDLITQTQMSLGLETVAEGAAWPRAFTFVGRGTSLVLITEPQACTGGTHRATILTQRGETPLLLRGCCSLSGD